MNGSLRSEFDFCYTYKKYNNFQKIRTINFETKAVTEINPFLSIPGKIKFKINRPLSSTECLSSFSFLSNFQNKVAFNRMTIKNHTKMKTKSVSPRNFNCDI